MQGERDSRERHSAVYERSLKALFAQLKSDFPEIPIVFVIGKLSDFGKDNKQTFTPNGKKSLLLKKKWLAIQKTAKSLKLMI